MNPSGLQHDDLSPRISVIITTKNSSTTLARCLSSVRRQTVQDVETIVVDNFSNDGTLEIAKSLANRVVSAGPERSAQRNIGAELALSPYLLFLDSDMELSAGVLEECLQKTSEFDALVVREITVGDTYLAKLRAYERNLYFRSGLFEAARFLRKTVFDGLGGYNTKLTGLEDYDLQGRLEDKSCRIGYVESVIYHHEEDLKLAELLRKKAYYARSFHRYRESHSQRAWRQFGPHRISFIIARGRKSPLATCAVVLFKLAEFLSSGVLNLGQR